MTAATAGGPRTDTERLDWLEKTGGMWDVYQNNDGLWYIEDDGEHWSGRTFREALDKLIDDSPLPGGADVAR